MQLSHVNEKGLYICEKNSAGSLSKSTQMLQTDNLNRTECRENMNWSSLHTYTFEFVFFSVILGVILTSLISVSLTICVFQKKKKEEQCHNSKGYCQEQRSNGVNWEILKQLDKELECKNSLSSVCSFEVPSPMQLIEPKPFHSIGSLNTNDIYEVMKPGIIGQSKL